MVRGPAWREGLVVNLGGFVTRTGDHPMCSHTGDMDPVRVSILISLLTAVAVVVLAARLTPDYSNRPFLATLLDGLRHRDRGPHLGVIAAARRELREVDRTEDDLEGFFRATLTDAPAYVGTEEIVDGLRGRRARV
jgi:hypothetical protein